MPIRRFRARPRTCRSGFPTGVDAVLGDTRWQAGSAHFFRLAREAGVPAILDGDRAPDEMPELLDLATHVAFCGAGLARPDGPRRSAAPACRHCPEHGSLGRGDERRRRRLLPRRRRRSRTSRPFRSTPSTRSAPAIPGTAPSRWRSPKASPSARRCASPRRRRRSNAPVSAAVTARRAGSRSRPSFHHVSGRPRSDQDAGWRTRPPQPSCSAGPTFRPERVSRETIDPLPAARPSGRDRRPRPADDPARLSAPQRAQRRHEGRLRRRRLRRLHRGARAAARRPARLRAGQRLHPAPRPARRRRDGHGRGSCERRGSPSRAGGDGRPSRLAMRLLHAGHRDEPVRPVSGRPAGEPRRRQRCARRESLPLHRLPTHRRCRARGLRRVAAGRLHRQTCHDRGSARGARRRRRCPLGRRATASSPRRRARPRSRRLYEAHPDATLVAGCTDVGLWITKDLARARQDDLARARAGTRQHRRGAGSACPLEPPSATLHADARARGDRSRSRRAHAPLRRRAGPRRRARSAATSPTARRSATSRRPSSRSERRSSCAQGERIRSLPLEDFFLAYRRQDRAPRRVRPPRRRAESSIAARRSAASRCRSASTRTSRR